MVSWFENIYLWFVENRESIVAFVTSGTFFTVVASLTAYIKSAKATNKNTNELQEVGKAITNNNNISNDVTDVKDGVQTNNANIIKCNNSLELLDQKFKEFSESMLCKVNSMLEVQSIVYSTVKDDNIRNSVNSILTMAKNADTISKAQLQEELDELKSKLAEKFEAVKEAVSDVVNKNDELNTVIDFSSVGENLRY